jgi:hypothetical protein
MNTKNILKEDLDKNYEDFLKNFIPDLNTKSKTEEELPRVDSVEPSSFIPHIETPNTYPSQSKDIIVKQLNTRYEEIELRDLPLGDFYQTGTKIYFRDLTVKEIEHFSTLSDDNLMDVKEKLNDILNDAIIYKNPNGVYGSYLDIKEGDRPFIIYMIREKTFPPNKGKLPKVDVKIKNPQNLEEDIIVTIPVIRANIDIYRNEEIMNYYDGSKKSIVIETTLKNDAFIISPPTIGLKRCFDAYLKIKYDRNEKINSSFYKIVPFLYPDKTYISYNDLINLEKWFEEELKPDEFIFLDDLINNHLKIGIRGLKKNMDNGKIIRTNKIYPKRIKSIFMFQDAFRLFLKK